MIRRSSFFLRAVYRDSLLNGGKGVGVGGGGGHSSGWLVNGCFTELMPVIVNTCILFLLFHLCR